MNTAPFALERWLCRYEPQARYHLASIGLTPYTLSDLAISNEELQRVPLGYIDSNGTLPLREAIARTYENQDPDHILVTHGGIEAIHLVLMAHVEPGKRAVVMTPGYQGLSEPLRANGMEVVEWPLRFEDGYQPDLALLKTLLPGARLLVLNSPHNPTGAFLGKEVLREILDMADACGCTVICDEVYRGLALTDEPHPSVVDLSSKAFAIGSFSKLYGLAGLRIGWIVGDPEVLARCWHFKDYKTLSNNTLGEYLGTKVLEKHEQYRVHAVQTARASWKKLQIWLSEHEDWFEWVEPKGGLSVFPRLRRGDSESFCQELLAREGILLLPGHVYGEPQHVRFGFGNGHLLDEGLPLLSRCLENALWHA